MGRNAYMWRGEGGYFFTIDSITRADAWGNENYEIGRKEGYRVLLLLCLFVCFFKHEHVCGWEYVVHVHLLTLP